MPYRRRLLPLLAVLGLVAVPAVALRAACVGKACDEGRAGAEPRVPFCSLPEALRDRLAGGFYEGRSPDVLAVPEEPVLWGWSEDGQRGVDPAWPSELDPPSGAVPILFWGTGVDRGASIDGAQLDSVAPTLWRIIGRDWEVPAAHPGRAIELSTGAHPRLVMIFALKGIGTAEITSGNDAWPFLRGMLRDGTGTLRGGAGSLPLDPAATLATLGTGGPPRSHGITGTFLRNEEGALTRAWGAGAPASVITTIADDLEGSVATGPAPRVGLVGDDRADLGVIGRDWYATGDRDQVRIVRPNSVPGTTERVLRSGFGADPVTDLLTVVLSHSVRDMDAQINAIVETGTRVADGAMTVVVAGTGSASGPRGGAPTVPLSEVTAGVDAVIPGSMPAVEATNPGGIFLDQDALTSGGVGSGVAVQTLGDMRADGDAVFADAFGGFAVQFERFC